MIRKIITNAPKLVKLGILLNSYYTITTDFYDKLLDIVMGQKKGKKLVIKIRTIGRAHINKTEREMFNKCNLNAYLHIDRQS